MRWYALGVAAVLAVAAFRSVPVDDVPHRRRTDRMTPADRAIVVAATVLAVAGVAAAALAIR